MTLAEFEDFCEATKHTIVVPHIGVYGIDGSLIDENLRLGATRWLSQFQTHLRMRRMSQVERVLRIGWFHRRDTDFRRHAHRKARNGKNPGFTSRF